MIGQTLGKLVFKLDGWTYTVNPDAISDPKNVIIGFPHTSNMDTIRAMALFHILGLNYHILVKQEWFKPIVGSVLRAMGCVPVDRKSSKNVVQQMVDEFAKHKKFSLVVAPEATRAKNGEKNAIKTGFWYIAKAANVPILLMLADNKIQNGSIFTKIMPSEDMDADLKKIQAAYAPYGIDIKLPEKKEKA